MGDISVANVMAMRVAILDRNAALRNTVAVPAATGPAGGRDVAPTAPVSFSATLDTMVQKVNADLEREDVATEAYERGETTNIATVALMQARASVSFETVLQVRNKVLSAYKDIMNMPV